jgi:putative DNA-invertase from lambdoid prophage Rac
VPVLSVREPWLDTSGAVRPLLVAIFGWVAERERARVLERTKAGLARARAQGKRLGRPRLPPLKFTATAADVERGSSRRAAARGQGISEAAPRGYLAAQKASSLPTLSQSHPFLCRRPAHKTSG